MIHKYALIAEYEFDDENGEYVPPSSREVERNLANAMFPAIKHADLKETHFEVERGSLVESFGLAPYLKP